MKLTKRFCTFVFNQSHHSSHDINHTNSNCQHDFTCHHCQKPVQFDDANSRPTFWQCRLVSHRSQLDCFCARTITLVQLVCRWPLTFCSQFSAVSDDWMNVHRNTIQLVALAITVVQSICSGTTFHCNSRQHLQVSLFSSAHLATYQSMFQSEADRGNYHRLLIRC